MGLTLTYVHSDHFVVSPDILMERYSNTDIKYMCTFKLEDNACTAESKRILGDLKPLIIDGPGWTYVKRCWSKRDGRGAILDLKRQADGIAVSR